MLHTLRFILVVWVWASHVDDALGTDQANAHWVVWLVLIALCFVA
jgi:hypothetical protein